MVVDAAIDGLGACVAIRVDIAQNKQSYIAGYNLRVFIDVNDQLISQSDRVPFVSAMNTRCDHNLSLTLPKRVHFQRTSRNRVTDHDRTRSF